MNILHYLYTKGETVLNYRLSGRLLIITPVWLFGLFFFSSLVLNVVSQFLYWLIAFCFWGILYGITFIILTKKKIKLKTWKRKYKNVSNFWAYLYLFSPLIALWLLL